jgi:hypothetical protein
MADNGVSAENDEVGSVVSFKPKPVRSTINAAEVNQVWIDAEIETLPAPDALFLARMSGLPLRCARPRARGQPQTTGGVATPPPKKRGVGWGPYGG